MLQQPDVYQQRILKLADFIEHSDFFDMRHWDCCIYGHIVKVAKDELSKKRVGNPISKVMDWLGRPVSDWTRLVSNGCQSKEQAARMLRHLAVTGEFPDDWNSDLELRTLYIHTEVPQSEVIAVYEF